MTCIVIACAAAENGDDADRSQSIGPTHRVDFPSGDDICSARFSDDGNFLIVLVGKEAVNLWSVAISYWPEILGTLSIIVVPLALWRAWHVWHRAQIPGEPHCRSCNYCLAYLTSQRCPECGTPVRRPVIGRSTRSRIVPLALLASAFLVPYVTLVAAAAPRQGFVSEWLHWWSFDVDDWARITRRPRYAIAREVLALSTVDLRTDHRMTRVVCSFPRPRRPDGLISPDGRFVISVELPSAELSVIDAASCSVLHEVPSPHSQQAVRCGWVHVGFGRDDREYVVRIDGDLSTLMEVNLQSGAHRTLVTSRARKAEFFVLSDEEHLRFAERSVSDDKFRLFSTAEVRVHEIDSDRQIRTVSARTSSFPGQFLRTAVADQTLAVIGHQIVEFDSSLSSKTVRLSIPRGRVLGWRGITEAAGRMLVTELPRTWPFGKRMGQYIAIDLVDWRVIAEFKHPLPLPVRTGHELLAIAPNRSRFAVHVVCDQESVNEITVFNLAPTDVEIPAP